MTPSTSESDRRSRLDWREAIAYGLVACGAYAVIVTELLSLGVGHDLTAPRSGHLTRVWLVVVWVPVLIAIAWVVVRRRGGVRNGLAVVTGFWRESELRVRLAIAACVVIAALVGLTAIVAAPNNWDSMTYHLTRVAQWVRLGGVAHYATHFDPQLYQPPGAEMLVAQLQVLTGSDRFAAGVQWIAFLAVLPIASLAAARLGAGRFGQTLAALLVATTPMAIMQGSSTQNDLLLSLWLLIAATLALCIARGGERVAIRSLLAAAALALAVLTKGTALIYGLPVAALLVWAVVMRAGWRRASALAIAALAILIALNAGQWLRNHETYGAYVSAGSGPNIYKNEAIGPGSLVSNLARNASNHLDLPVGAANRATRSAIDDGLGLIGIDASDPRTTHPGAQFEVGPLGPHEDHAGNLVQTLLAFWAIAVALFVARWRTRERLVWVAMLVAQALLFCALLKWQNWHARLHLPLFVLAAPLAAACLAQLQRRRLVDAIAVLLVAASTLYVFYNYTRPLVGDRAVYSTPRAEQYFAPRPNLEAPYRALVTEVDRRGIDRLAVVASTDQWEYPLYALSANPRLVVYDALVANASGRYASDDQLPAAVACIQCDESRHAQLAAAGLTARALRIGPVKHDARLTEVPATVELWTREP